jgi:hypothetical protein
LIAALTLTLVLTCLGGVTLMMPRANAQVEARRERVYVVGLAMVLEGTRRLLLWTETYPADAEFAKFAYPLAAQYVEMAGHMTPPKKWVTVHPHLLLVVENAERAVDAAAAADLATFRQRIRIVREELATLDVVLKQLKLRLPELAR